VVDERYVAPTRSCSPLTELLNPPELDFKPKTVESMMTEEEERELAELMSDDD
jgi:hypothetical protein